MPKRLSKLSAPLGIERDYQSDLRRIVTRVKVIIDDNIVKSLPSIMDEVNAGRPTSDSIRFDNISQKVADLFTATQIQIDSEITDFDIDRITQAKGSEMSNWNKAQITKVLKQGLGIDLFQGEPWLAEELRIFAINNSNLIKSNNAAFLSNVENLTFDGMRRGLRHEEIANQILARNKTELGKASSFKKAKNRANLIARDQINKLNGNLIELRQKNAGVKRYIWRTNIDGRERATHNDWNGQTFTWAKGSPIGTHPGDEIQCRCYAEPDLSDLLK